MYKRQPLERRHPRERPLRVRQLTNKQHSATEVVDEVKDAAAAGDHDPSVDRTIRSPPVRSAVDAVLDASGNAAGLPHGGCSSDDDVCHANATKQPTIGVNVYGQPMVPPSFCHINNVGRFSYKPSDWTTTVAVLPTQAPNDNAGGQFCVCVVWSAA